jgi:hypothetical protein
VLQQNDKFSCIPLAILEVEQLQQDEKTSGGPLLLDKPLKNVSQSIEIFDGKHSSLKYLGP